MTPQRTNLFDRMMPTAHCRSRCLIVLWLEAGSWKPSGRLPWRVKRPIGDGFQYGLEVTEGGHLQLASCDHQAERTAGITISA